MADGHAPINPGSGLNVDTDPSFTNSESATVQRTRVSLYGASGSPGNGLAVNSDGTLPIAAASGKLVAGSIADLATLIARIIVGTADAATAGMVGAAGYNGTNWDRLRTQAASGYGLGVLSVGGAATEQTWTISIRDAVGHQSSSFNDLGTKRRMFGYVSTLDQPVAVQVLALTQNSIAQLYAFTIPAGNVTLARGGLSSGGFSPQSGTTPTATGNLGAIDSPALSFSFYAVCVTPPTVGSLTVDYIGLM